VFVSLETQKLAKKKNYQKRPRKTGNSGLSREKIRLSQIVVSVVFDSVSFKKKKKNFNNVGIHQANFIDTIMGWGRR
jgi:hypothetical protein